MTAPILLVCCLADSSVLSGFQTAQPPARSADEHIIRSEADLVVLPVTVKDHQGRFVSGLQQQDFQVYENGQPQTISDFSHSDVPVTAGLVVDSSGSMHLNRPEVAAAAKDFLSSSNPRDQVFVVNFNEQASLGLPSGVAFTSNVGELEAAVFRGPSTGMTALYDAIGLGLKHLNDSLDNNKKALIIISDGGDNASHEDFHKVLNTALHENAIIYAIGILDEQEADVSPRILRKLAKDTGGRAFFPTSASVLPDICHEIATDLREQYTIAYIPSDRRENGAYRTIRVTVHAPGKGSLVVRTRKGYFAPSSAAELRESSPAQ
ncbi:MAG TPA: VWA domain-containing protein [Candidatus Acidoferrales bacterium]|jgi:VWFA-related protein|nr:VWA domain-containing protein [Candidatus Acidoferrales bacterium]